MATKKSIIGLIDNAEQHQIDAITKRDAAALASLKRQRDARCMAIGAKAIKALRHVGVVAPRISIEPMGRAGIANSVRRRDFYGNAMMVAVEDDRLLTRLDVRDKARLAAKESQITTIKTQADSLRRAVLLAENGKVPAAVIKMVDTFCHNATMVSLQGA